MGSGEDRVRDIILLGTGIVWNFHGTKCLML